MISYYTWRDVERIFKYNIKKWNKEWIDINVYYDEVIIYTKKDITKDICEGFSENLKEIFAYHYNKEKQEINLDYENKVLVIKYEILEEYIEKEYIPLFKESRKTQPFPEELKGVPVIAFHSYKGGVGRTLSMISTINSYSTMKKENGKPYKLLIVDSDIEAPGLTWLAIGSCSIDISLLDALSIVHESDNWETDALKFISKKIKETVLTLPVGDKVIEHYFLPAYRMQDGYKAINQIMSMPVVPENLVQMTNRQWIMGDFFSQLGKELGVDAVLIDLRAGISEFSAPLLLDPRIRKIYVTSTSLQSRKGTNALLRGIYKEPIDTKYPEPHIFISMVLTALSVEETNKMQDEILDDVEIFDYKNSKNTADDVDVNFGILPFAEELVHLEGFDMIYSKLSGTTMAKRIDNIVKLWAENYTEAIPEIIDKKERSDFLEELFQLTKNMEYAESTEMSNFLVTASIKNLVRKFKYDVPNAVILGAKGSGKTFIYSQLVRSVLWEGFMNKIDLNEKFDTETYIVPFLRPDSLKNLDFIIKNNEIIKNELGFHISIQNMNNTRDRIKMEDSENEVIWKNIWKRELLNSLGVNIQSFEELQEYLKSRDKRIVFVIDGIEDMFQNLSDNKNEKIALRSLIQGLVNEIRSIPNSRIGIIIFSRIDFAMNSIEQNFGQFRSLYSAYELKWTNVEALRLVLWIASNIKDVNGISYLKAKDIDIETAVQDAITTELYKLWGIKLGKVNSKEGNSANWVLSALSDLKGQLQPRDVVRFLKYSSEECRRENKIIYDDRYLSPTSIRNAIEPCSKEKIIEIKQEMEFLRKVFEKFETSDKKQMPFKLEQYNISKKEAELLAQQGYLYEIDDDYYMPEIIRYGLKFESTRKGRRKVVSLLNIR